MPVDQGVARVHERGRLSVTHVADALREWIAMTLEQRVAHVDGIHARQPMLLASVLAQTRLGATLATVEFLLEILIVTDLAMRVSGFQWPRITEAEQARHLARLVGHAQFTQGLAAREVSEAQRQYILEHPEPVLLAWVVERCREWLRDVDRRDAAQESDKYVLMAAINLVDCIAHASTTRPE